MVEHLEAVVGGDGGHGGGGTGDASKKDAYYKRPTPKEDAQDANGREARVHSGFKGSFWLGLPLPQAELLTSGMRATGDREGSGERTAASPSSELEVGLILPHPPTEVEPSRRVKHHAQPFQATNESEYSWATCPWGAPRL